MENCNKLLTQSHISKHIMIWTSQILLSVKNIAYWHPNKFNKCCYIKIKILKNWQKGYEHFLSHFSPEIRGFFTAFVKTNIEYSQILCFYVATHSYK